MMKQAEAQIFLSMLPNGQRISRSCIVNRTRDTKWASHQQPLYLSAGTNEQVELLVAPFSPPAEPSSSLPLWNLILSCSAETMDAWKRWQWSCSSGTLQGHARSHTISCDWTRSPSSADLMSILLYGINGKSFSEALGRQLGRR
ncbi:Uncharacterized protein APZ42_029850 [Daphnia magna]|uniref:Uncharacterized protein n=1 Tax=Daphnia magna TaxID=35525 RepID=A0A164P9N1_9CRUS|nr:Uncharacterized protein APZ42_029850 [Daphnia magna]